MYAARVVMNTQSMTSSSAVLLVGIDEAGYGPVLGPLVATAMAFEAPAELVDASLWDVLRRSVSERVSTRDRRVAIVDSKKLHRGDDGLAHLERSALAAIAAFSSPPASLRGLLHLLAPHVLGMLAEYPWYREADPALPLAADADAARLAGECLARDAAVHGVRLAGLWSEPLPEGHYNRLVGRTRNKAVVLLGQTLRLVQRVAEAFPDRTIHYLIDKQGGRGHYREALMRAFEGRTVQVVNECDQTSVYVLHGAAPPWSFTFAAQGESRHLPVALASILSKYQREVFMNAFNSFWRRHAPQVAPTAGYYVDGQRFLRDADEAIRRLGVDRALLVRSR